MYLYSNKLIRNRNIISNSYTTLVNLNCFYYSVSFFNNNVTLYRTLYNKTYNNYNKFNKRWYYSLSNEENRNCSSISDSLNERRNNTENLLSENKNFLIKDKTNDFGDDSAQKDRDSNLNNLAEKQNSVENINGLEDSVLKTLINEGFKDMDEYIFEKIDKCILKDLDSFSISDISNLLQLTLKNYYSQNLIEALILKLQQSKPSDLHVGTLALLIQNLGRIQPADFQLETLSDFFDKTCEHLVKLDNVSESHFSSIVYGFQRLHYVNYEFLSEVVKRYKKDNNFNVNSITISLSSMVKLNYFNIDLILHIYRIISKSLSHMTLQTTIQLLNTISKIHDTISNEHNDTRVDSEDTSGKTDDSEDSLCKELETEDECKLDDIGTNMCIVSAEKKNKLYKYNYKLVNYILKIICKNYLDQLNVVQISIVLNTLNKLNFRKVTYLSKLVNTIPNNSTRDEVVAEKKPKNLYAFSYLPKPPFNYQQTCKKLQSVEPNNLILICDAITGLEYYTEYSLNILFIIKDIINPILHELKSTNILMYLLSFTNICFNNYQLNEECKLNTSNKTKKIPASEVSTILKLLNYYENYDNNWYDKENSRHNSMDKEIETREILLKKVKNRLNRSYWKEELVLNCMENLIRHLTYIKSSPSMLRKFKFFYTLLMNNVYLQSFPIYYNLEDGKVYEESDLTERVSMTNAIPMVIPENLVEIYNELYDSKESNEPEVLEFDNKRMYVDKQINCFKLDILIENK
ncbi:hypothetical protein TpMuguga_04g00600 [Theileria parva strain Muguga]|uniref:Uncharacterized protein n=1 Tax=Theileria parva TaxID=5875 RepID=Q4N1X7_THEPA|nr:uncharacterized protein TpMuguga_04g00600 [Theileria parva strain Muguga]EAN31952.1 hypothetical protein TpMuguga_04g00600 [Theileria parva strain Muguga]|eukprot:XP_764235.1 hypothetical protein [Theileria parva strain Muguga]